MRRVARVPHAGLLLSAAAWFFTAAAGAQAADAAAPGREERVRVEYHAPAACPSEAEFQERVRSRVQRARFAEPGEPGHTFDVSVDPVQGAAGFLGHLEFVDTDGQRAVRLLQGARCDELVSSLALITALALDDRAAEAPPAAPSPEPSPPLAAASAPTPKSNPEPGAPPRLPEPPARSRPRGSRYQVELGVNLGALSWVHARAALQFGVYVQLAPRAPAWQVRLSAFDARRSIALPNDGLADFPADFLRLEGCPLTVPLGWDFNLSPCLAFDGGQLRASVQPSDTLTPKQRTQDILWAAGVALLRLNWVYHERLVLGLDGELGVPLVRHTYTVENPDETVLEVPKIGFGGNFGVGLRFP